MFQVILLELRVVETSVNIILENVKTRIPNGVPWDVTTFERDDHITPPSVKPRVGTNVRCVVWCTLDVSRQRRGVSYTPYGKQGRLSSSRPVRRHIRVSLQVQH